MPRHDQQAEPRTTYRRSGALADLASRHEFSTPDRGPRRIGAGLNAKHGGTLQRGLSMAA